MKNDTQPYTGILLFFKTQIAIVFIEKYVAPNHEPTKRARENFRELLIALKATKSNI